MIVLVLEEVRYASDLVQAEVTAVRQEKDALQIKVLTTEEECRSLYDRVRLTEGTQKAYDELRRTQQAVVQQERLRALGQMSSGVAHDINNALCPIGAYADLFAHHTEFAENASPLPAKYQSGGPGHNKDRGADAGILPPGFGH